MNIDKKLNEKLLPFINNTNGKQIFLSNNILMIKLSVWRIPLEFHHINCDETLKQLLFSQDKIKIELALNLL